MPRIRFRNFSKGLYVTGPRDAQPEGTLRRAQGVDRVFSASIRSRWGSSVLGVAAGTPHSVVVFNDKLIVGVGDSVYEGTRFISSGMDGEPLTFLKAQSVAGQGPDFLFVVGGGFNIRITEAGNASQLGIAQPFSGLSTGRENFAINDTFKRWERFDATAGATLDDVTATIDPDVRPPDGSTASLKLTVAAEGTGSYTRGLPAGGTGTTFIIENFNGFATGGGGRVSSLQDWIVLDVRVDEIRNLESIELLFDATSVAGRAASFDVAIGRQILVDDATVQTLLNKPEGSADLPGVEGNEINVFAREPSAQFERTSAEALGVTKIVGTNNAWTRLQIPKSSFDIRGAVLSPREAWGAVAAYRLVVKANDRGPVNVWFDNGSMFGGVGVIGRYRHRITHRDTVTGHRSNPNPREVTTEGAWRTGLRVSGVVLAPSVPGRQLVRELWRTFGDGDAYFKVGDLPITGTTFVDECADFRGMHDVDVPASSVGVTGFYTLRGVLDTDQLLTFDNGLPPLTVRDMFGPAFGRMFWTRDSDAGAEGRVYYSPAGRHESVEDFSVAGSREDPCVKGFVWGGTPFVFTENRLYEGIGSAESPVVWREVFGVPGTTLPLTVVVTPHGIVYCATDGVRVFNGSGSRLVAPDAVEIAFRGGQSVPGVTRLGALGFLPTSAVYTEDEYIVRSADSTITLGVNLRTGVWRNLGAVFDAMTVEDGTKDLVVCVGTSIRRFEVPGTTSDAGSAIPWDVETAGILVDADIATFLTQRVYIDINTAGQSVTPSVITADGAAVVLPAISTTSRQLVERALALPSALIGLRLQGFLGAARAELFGVEFDVHVPETPGQGT